MLTLAESQGKGQVCPRDGQRSCAYVDAIEPKDVGPAAYMLSYTWGFTVGDIADALQCYCERNALDPAHTFVDLLPVHQPYSTMFMRGKPRARW